MDSKSVFIGAGSFEDYGGWSLDTQFILNMGSEYLLAHGLGSPVRDAEARAVIPDAGEYNLWAYTKDWVAHWKQGVPPGLFKIEIGGVESETVFGTNGKEWGWQYGGSIKLNAGEAKIALRDLTGFEGRCAGIYLRASNSEPPRGIETLRRKRGEEINIEYDLLVAGGGLAGICAAVSAARAGLKTALVHDRGVLGGNNSSEVRVWLGGETNFEPYPKLGDIVREFEPKDKAHYGPSNVAELYEDEKRLSILRNEKNIDLYLNCFLTSAETRDGFISGAAVYNVKTGEEFVLRAGLYADCTGDGTLGHFAGADYETTTNGHMGLSNLWNVEEADSPKPFPRCPWAIDLSDADFPGRRRTQSVYNQSGPDAMGGWYWESGMEHPPVEFAEYARDTNFRAMYGAFDCVKNVDGDYENFYLKFAAYVAGKRESRRLLGDVVLCKSDAYGTPRFDDGLVPATWSFDVHYPERKFYLAFREGDAFLTKDYHEAFPAPFFVPYRCLYSRNVNNLFMAGRDVSVTHDALGAVRVMRTCGMMGEAVGAAAYICKSEGATPRGVYKKYLSKLFEKFK